MQKVDSYYGNKKRTLSFDEWHTEVVKQMRKNSRTKDETKRDERISARLSRAPMWDYWVSGYSPEDTIGEI